MTDMTIANAHDADDCLPGCGHPDHAYEGDDTEYALGVDFGRDDYALDIFAMNLRLLRDDNWATLACTRTARGLECYVDGQPILL